MHKKLMFIRPPFMGMGKYKPLHLGIATLYSYLKDKLPFIDYSYVDALSHHLSINDVLDEILYVKPDFLAFTVKTMQVEQTKELIQKVLDVYSPTIICGGNHVSIEPESLIEAGADYAVVGEGEKALEKILNFELELQDIDINEAPNIMSKKNIDKTNIQPITELKGEELVPPNWSIMNVQDYNENIHLNKGIPALPIMASRGCPFMCDFCSTHLTWTRRVRYRTIESVLQEIEDGIKNYNIRDFHFYDDNLMLNKNWLEEFLKEVIERDLKFNWICLSRPDILIRNKDLLPLMKKSGCKGFELGFETDDDELYLKMNKKNTKSIFREAYDLLCHEDFEMIEFLIMCFYEGETINSLYETYKQLNQYKKQKAFFVSSRYFATPFKGTRFSENVGEHGIDLGITNKYKYAIYLNYMPYSFLNSNLDGFYINSKVLAIKLKFLDIENIIYENDWKEINERINPSLFAEVLNECAKNKEKIADLCEKIKEIHSFYGEDEAIYEYVGRMIEFAISKGVVKHKEDSIL